MRTHVFAFITVATLLALSSISTQINANALGFQVLAAALAFASLYSMASKRLVRKEVKLVSHISRRGDKPHA